MNVDDSDRWEEAFNALNPYAQSGSDVLQLVAMLNSGKPIPPSEAKWLAKLLDGYCAQIFGYGLAIVKFPKFRASKRGERSLREDHVYWLLKEANTRFGKLEAAVQAVAKETGLSRAKLMAV